MRGGLQGTVPLATAVGLAGLAGSNNVGLGLCAQQGAFLAGESPAAPWQGGCVDKKPGRPGGLVISFTGRAGCPSRDGIRRACVKSPGRSRGVSQRRTGRP